MISNQESLPVFNSNPVFADQFQRLRIELMFLFQDTGGERLLSVFPQNGDGALHDDEKVRADAHFLELQGEYGDQMALERRKKWVRKQKREVSGSRVGSLGNLRIQVADATGYTWELSGRDYFDVLESYIHDFESHTGEGEFGELEVLQDDQRANR